MKKEKEISVQEIVDAIIRNLKYILLGACLFGIIVSILSFLSGFSSSNNSDIIEEHNKEVSFLETKLERLDHQYFSALEYSENSIYFNINPYSEGQYNISFIIDTNYKINPDISIQDPDKSEQIISAYCLSYKDQACMNSIYQLLGQVVDERYIDECISVFSEDMTNTINIKVIYPNMEDAKNIAEVVYQYMQTNVKPKLPTHTVELISENSLETIDNDLIIKQNNHYQNIESINKEMTSTEEKIEKLKINNPDINKNMRNMIKKSVRIFIVIAFLGVVLGCSFVVIKKINDDRIWSPQDITKYSDVRVLELRENIEYMKTLIEIDTKKRGINKLLVIRDETANNSQNIVNELSKDENFSIKIGKSLLTDAETINLLQETEGVLLLVEKGKTKIPNILQEIDFVTKESKELVGIILV